MRPHSSRARCRSRSCARVALVRDRRVAHSLGRRLGFTDKATANCMRALYAYLAMAVSSQLQYAGPRMQNWIPFCRAVNPLFICCSINTDLTPLRAELTVHHYPSAQDMCTTALGLSMVKHQQSARLYGEQVTDHIRLRTLRGPSSWSWVVGLAPRSDRWVTI